MRASFLPSVLLGASFSLFATTLANPVVIARDTNAQHTDLEHALARRHNTFYPDPEIHPNVAPTNPPLIFAVPLFPTFDLIDLFGPLDILNILSKSYNLTLFLVAPTLDPVSSAPLDMTKSNPKGSSFFPSVVPTHTFATVPNEIIDVVIVPGGPGVRQAEGTLPTRNWLTELFSPNKTEDEKPGHLLTICTGSGLVAQTGLLDGKYATTNKFGWESITAMGPDVNWVSPARFVRDGNVWSSSGVTAGLDLIFQFVSEEYNPYNATRIGGIVEHEDMAAGEDVWGGVWQVEDSEGVVGEGGVVSEGSEEMEEDESYCANGKGKGKGKGRY